MQLQIKASERALVDPALEGAGALPVALRLHSRMEPLEGAWRAIEAQGHLSLHQSYDWCRAWVETHGCEPLIVEGVCEGRTQFILPLEIVRHGPVRTAHLIGTAFSNINTGLYTEAFRVPGAGIRLREALERARSELTRSFDLLLLEKIPLEWRDGTSPFAGLPAVLNQNAAFQLELFEDFDETLAQLNGKRRRKKARSSERRLAAVGGYEHVVAQGGGQSLALLETFFRQKGARFEAMGLPDVFRDEPTRAFFRKLAAMPAADGNYCLRLHALRLKGAHEGHIAAVTGLSRKGDHVICQFGSIDDSVAAEASPGEFLFHLVIEQLCREGAPLFDFGIGDQPYKRSWCRIETMQHDLLFPVTIAGRAAAATHRAKTAAKRLIKQSPQVYAFVQRMRFGRAEATRGGETD